MAFHVLVWTMGMGSKFITTRWLSPPTAGELTVRGLPLEVHSEASGSRGLLPRARQLLVYFINSFIHGFMQLSICFSDAGFKFQEVSNVKTRLEEIVYRWYIPLKLKNSRSSKNFWNLSFLLYNLGEILELFHSWEWEAPEGTFLCSVCSVGDTWSCLWRRSTWTPAPGAFSPAPLSLCPSLLRHVPRPPRWTFHIVWINNRI